MTKYFIKPIGTSEPGGSWDDTKFAPRCEGSEEDCVWFARNPEAIHIGDFLIFFAVGNNRKVVGVYEVISEPYTHKDSNRWNYAVKIKLLSKGFSRNWARNSLYLDDIVDNYKERFTENVTLERRDLNGLKYGPDKLRVTKEFANFTIECVKEFHKG